MWQETLISTDQLGLGAGWRAGSAVLAQNLEEGKRVIFNYCIHCSVYCSFRGGDFLPLSLPSSSTA